MYQVFTRISNFFKTSHRNNPKAFFIEIAEALSTMAASLILSLTVLDPATEWFIPLFLIGGLLGTVSCYLRKSTAIVLTIWFTGVNSWAFIQLFFL